MKIKAAILVNLKAPLEMAEIESPAQLNYGQVLVKVHYSGICGAQINEIEGAKGPDKFLPHLLGHEGYATVSETGDGVRTVKKGDKVVMHWRPSNGIQSQTPTYQWNGKTVNAGWVTTFNDHAIVSENRLTPIPADFDNCCSIWCSTVSRQCKRAGAAPWWSRWQTDAWTWPMMDLD